MSMSDAASCVLLNWKRPDNVFQILTSLCTSQRIGDVTIWNSNCDGSVFVPKTPAKVVNTSWDAGLRSRWILGLLASREAVLVQDDDLIVPKGTLAALCESWVAEPDIIHGTFGRMPQSNGMYRATDVFGEVDIVLTRCCILHRKYCAAFFNAIEAWPDLREENVHDDIIMSYLVRAISGKQNKAYPLPVEELPAPHAISSRPDHIERRTKIMRRCLELGPAIANGCGIKQVLSSKVTPAANRFASDLSQFRESLPQERRLIDQLSERSIRRYPLPVVAEAVSTDTQGAIGVRNMVYETRPAAVHASGSPESHSAEFWRRLTKEVLKLPARSFPNDKRLTIVTWNNGHEVSLLEKCLDRVGVPLLVLGRDVRSWRNRHKVDLTCQALATIDCEYVMGMDAFDTLLLAEPGQVVERFQKHCCKLLFSAEECCYPINAETQALQDALAPEDARWRYLNSGLWMGETQFLRTFFEHALNSAGDPKLPQSDQAVFQRLLPQYPREVRLDYRCELFQNLSVAREYRRELAADAAGTARIALVGEAEPRCVSPRSGRLRRPLRHPRAA